MATSYTVLSRKQQLVLLPETINAVGIPFESLILLATVVAVLMAVSAQVVIRLTMRQTQRLPARMSGFAAARKVLDDAGLEDVAIEQVPGSLSDHYEPLHRVLQLSGPVYHGRSLAAVGTAAHEAGHALQHAAGDFRVRILGLAGIAASFGSGAGIILMILGVGFRPLIWLGACVFCGAVFFQIANLPGELNASRRAKQRLLELDIVADEDLRAVLHIINAATLTYLAVTLQTILTSLVGMLRYMSRRA
ncbi:MAG: zinc metallopeptidase [Pirellulaceae bacterium]|jgi:hypothetical protein|nr:zinc metallopeptidase [Pirellulaceae bacterium]